MINLQEVITDSRILADRYIVRNGFVFTAITHPANVYDAIVIKQPTDVPCFSPKINGSAYSLKAHIDFINAHGVEKALIIAENIDFIEECPTLVHLRIVPADSVGNGFDYSPLYKLPQVRSLQCVTIYGFKQAFSTCIDCGKLKGVESLHITNDRYKNYNRTETLKSLGLSNYGMPDLSDAFVGSNLDTLSVIQSKIKSLEGIQKAPNLQCLYLHYNCSLQDISALRKASKTLKALRIENCPKINDFSVLVELEKLELLELSGNNTLPNLDFIKKMKNLKTFVFSMNVLDGDLSPCLGLEYVYSEKNRKHYNLKDSNFPKGVYRRGNEGIEMWRRLE